MNYPDLMGSLVVLRPLNPTYFEEYRALFSPLVAQILHAGSVESEMEYVRDRYEKMQQGIGIFYLIFNQAENKLMGAIAVREHERGQLYSWLNEQYWGGGRYQEALKLVTDYYFAQTGMPVITAQVDMTNPRSYAALKKFGFTDTGTSHGPFGKQYELVLHNKKAPEISSQGS